MRYLVKAKLRQGREVALTDSIESGTLGSGSVAGNEYIKDMRKARLYENGLAEWIEVCFCSTPLQEEKPYWEEYFDLIEIKDAAKRKACKHENGKDYWSCISCRCTEKKEMELETTGSSFLEKLSEINYQKKMYK
jgi:hypothetical protein